MRFGGVILCGGQSKRMGAPKPWLPFGGRPLLAHVAHGVGQCVTPIVVVGALDQELPPLSGNIMVAYDREPNRGPLEGIAVGLSALCDRVDAAFLCSCDAALLSPAVVSALCDLLGDNDAVVPVVGGFRQTLLSVFRTSLVPVVQAMLESEEQRAHRLFDRVSTHFVGEAEFREIDPELMSVRPMNTFAEYQAALAAAGMNP